MIQQFVVVFFMSTVMMFVCLNHCNNLPPVLEELCLFTGCNCNSC